MNINRARVLISASLLAAAAAVTATIALTGPAEAQPASAMLGSSPSVTAQRPVFFDDAGRGVIRPSHYSMGGMANELLSGMTWPVWRSSAYGSGTLKILTCTSGSCPHGAYTSYPILAVLWRAEPWPGHAGQRYFTRITWIFTGPRPPHSPAAYTTSLP